MVAFAYGSSLGSKVMGSDEKSNVQGSMSRKTSDDESSGKLKMVKWMMEGSDITDQ